MAGAAVIAAGYNVGKELKNDVTVTAPGQYSSGQAKQVLPR